MSGPYNKKPRGRPSFNHQSRKARALRKRQLIVAKRAEKEIQRRDEAVFRLGIDPASGGDAGAVALVRVVGDKIEVVDTAIFTPPNCHHVGGTDACVSECRMIYG